MNLGQATRLIRRTSQSHHPRNATHAGKTEVLYQRVPRLFALLALGRGDGRYAKLMRQLGRVDLFILDDLGPEPLLPVTSGVDLPQNHRVEFREEASAYSPDPIEDAAVLGPIKAKPFGWPAKAAASLDRPCARRRRD